MMNRFDKICSVLAIPFGVVFMLLGISGLFLGFRFQCKLPPVYGVLPFFVGWAMCVTLIRFWRITSKLEEANAQAMRADGVGIDGSEEYVVSNDG
jgi:hypothetical protein